MIIKTLTASGALPIEGTVVRVIGAEEENRFVEVAFFGGNFTGLPVGMQNDYLEIVQPYLDKGLIDGIRCSTRPDYITLKRVQKIKRYGMRNIELGAQSTNDEVLKLCKEIYEGEIYGEI